MNTMAALPEPAYSQLPIHLRTGADADCELPGTDVHTPHNGFPS